MQHHIIDARICPDQYWVGDFPASVDVQEFLAPLDARISKTPNINYKAKKRKTCPVPN